MTTHLVSNFANRLREALDIRNMTAAELSKLTQINEGTISNYKQGKYKPKQDKLELISTVLNVSAGWLLGADVPMEADIIPADFKPAHPAFKEPLKTAVNLFQQLDTADQNRIIGRMETMLENDKYQTKRQTQNA